MRLVEVDNADGTVLQTYSYHYDGSEVAVEYQPTTTYTYYLGLGIDQPVMRTDGTNKQWYYANAQGNISAVADNSGTILEEYEYNAQGQFQVQNGSGTTQAVTRIGNFILYTGRNYDYETGNYFYRARYYSPVLGRFISRDPLSGAEFSQGTNLYAYCANNYLNLSDPTGKSFWGSLGNALTGGSIGGGLGASVGAAVGGMVGAVTGAIAGAVGGLGVGAIPGAVAGFEAGSSIGAAAGGLAGSVSGTLGGYLSGGGSGDFNPVGAASAGLNSGYNAGTTAGIVAGAGPLGGLAESALTDGAGSLLTGGGFGLDAAADALDEAGSSLASGLLSFDAAMIDADIDEAKSLLNPGS